MGSAALIPLTIFSTLQGYFMTFDKPELLALLTVLASVVGVLWTIHLNHNKREQERLKRYEKMHTDSQAQVVHLTGEYRELKGRMDGVEKLSNSVLERLTKYNKDSNCG